MIRRWISDVPSSISSSFASRIHFSTGSLTGVPPATERLHRSPGAPHGGLRGVKLRHRCLARDVRARVGEPRRTPDEQARCIDSKRHVRNAEGDGLMLRDRFPELLARLRVVDGVLERGTGEAGGGCRERDPREFERAHQPAKALALPTEPPVERNLEIVEKELGIDDRPLAHLAHRRPDREARIVLLDDERRDPLGPRSRVDRREDDVGRRRPGARDPALLSRAARNRRRCGSRSSGSLQHRSRHPAR